MSDSYTGADNLEVMLEAVNYNQYLKDLVRGFSESPEKVLDFGAGIGTFTDAVPDSANSVHCLEPDLAAQEILKAKGYWVHSSLDDLQGESFDYIFSLNVLEHIEDDGAALAHLYHCLKPGCRLFIYVPALNHLRTSMDDLVGHHRRYSRGSLTRVVQGAGFIPEEARYTDFLGYFATLAFRLMDVIRGEPDGTINRTMLLIYDRLFFPVSRLLSVPFGGLLGKNVYIVARKPN